MTDVQKSILIHQFENLNKESDYRDLLVGVARLGGFLARKGDGDPGWITLMRGYMKLFELEQGYLVAMKLMGKR